MTIALRVLVGAWAAVLAAVAAVTVLAMIAGRRSRADRASRRGLGGEETPNTSPGGRHPAEPPAVSIWWCPFMRKYHSQPCIGHAHGHTDVNVDDFLALDDLASEDLGGDLYRLRWQATR